ncbi:thioesterase II family protein [Streptomyces albidoflavus]
MTGGPGRSVAAVPHRSRPGAREAGNRGPSRSAYLLPGQQDPAAAPMRLFCFHHAGGAASSFAGWQERLGSAVTVVPVQLPGREHRLREPRPRDFSRLVDELDEALDPLLEAPHAFYGHSMGGMVAHELTRRRLDRDRPPPRQLLVGACPPPHLPYEGTVPDRFTDEELTAWMSGLGGLPELVQRYPEWLRLAVAVLRDDLRLVHSRRPGPVHEPLPVPVRALAGAGDPLVTPRLAAEWARHTSADFRVFTLPGGHFFHRSASAIVLHLIASLLAAERGART